METRIKVFSVPGIGIESDIDLDEFQVINLSTRQ